MHAGRRDEEAIAALVESYRDGFHRLDFQQLCSLWDRRHEGLIYVAQELPEPLQGWDAIERYYARTTDSPEPMIAMTIDALSIQTFGDTALAFFTFLAHAERDLELAGRVSMVLRRNRDRWILIHYHRSALAQQAVQLAEGRSAA